MNTKQGQKRQPLFNTSYKIQPFLKTIGFFALIISCILGVLTGANGQTLNEAKKLTENEQYEAAAAMFKQLISREPANGTIYYFFGENLLLSENPDSAKLIFEKGLEAEPSNVLNTIGVAKIKLDILNVAEAKRAMDMMPENAELKTRYEETKARVEEAKAKIETVVTTSAKNSRVMIEAADALIHYKNKDLDKAKEYLDRAQPLDPKNPEIKILYGDVYTELNNGTLAADYYNQALDLDKKSARAIVNKGRLYKRSTNYDGAAEEFIRAISIDSAYAPAYRELGEVYFKLGKLEKAKQEYRHYLDLSKNNCGARLRYAAFLYLSRNYSDALNELAQLKDKCDPENLYLLRITTYCDYETKEFVKGLEVASKLMSKLSEDKRTSLDYEYYGKLLIANKQDSLGIIQLRAAYNLDLSKTDLLTDIAKAYMNLIKYPEAIQTIQEKIKIGKDVKTIDYMYLGQSQYFNSQFTEADSAFHKVNDLNDTYLSGWLWRAKSNTHIDTSSIDGLAKPFYEKVIELIMADPANLAQKYQGYLIEAYGYLAYYYILKKDNANGLLYLKKKSELPLDPEEMKKIKQAIDQLEGKKPPAEKR